MKTALREDESTVLDQMRSGYLSMGRASEILKMSVQDIQRLAQKHGVELGASREQQKQSMATAKRLMKR